MNLPSLALALCFAGCHPSRFDGFTDVTAPKALQSEISAHPAGNVAAISRVWNSYLAEKRDEFDCAPSQYWRQSEQQWTSATGATEPVCYDLAGLRVSLNRTHETLHIAPVRGTNNADYEITTRYRPSHLPASGLDALIGVETVYAVREGTEWKLSGAISRRTRNWQHETVGPFTYIFPPSHTFSRVQATHAAAFADSIADMLHVPRLTSIRYYIVSSGDEMDYIYGYAADTVWGPVGGQSPDGSRIVSGDKVFGEMHGHEIAHHVVRPLQGSNMNIVASEGVPTWLGGTRGRDYPHALVALRRYLVAHPSATLDTVIASNMNDMHNPGAALLASMVFARAGVAGIRQFMNSGPGIVEFRAGVSLILGESWDAVAQHWKQRALETP